MKIFLTSVLIFVSAFKISASSNLIKELRGKIEQINISFLENKFPGQTLIDEFLQESEKIGIDSEKLNKIIDSRNLNEVLKKFSECCISFRSFYTVKPELDTLKKVFRELNNKFNSTFGGYFWDELKNSTKQKIVIFSTSMSCECTLEMCYKQESEIQKLQKENPDQFDFAIIDCFSNFDLQSKYEIGFMPTVIIFNSANKEVKRFVRNENLYSKLQEYLQR